MKKHAASRLAASKLAASTEGVAYQHVPPDKEDGAKGHALVLSAHAAATKEPKAPPPAKGPPSADAPVQTPPLPLPAPFPIPMPGKVCCAMVNGNKCDLT